MKYITDLLVMATLSVITVTSVSQSPKKYPKTFYEAADSLQHILDSTVQLDHIIARRVDSIAEINQYLADILKSHDYRVYKYTNPRIKLIYKWQSGHWELIRKIHY